MAGIDCKAKIGVVQNYENDDAMELVHLADNSSEYVRSYSVQFSNQNNLYGAEEE